MNDWQKYFEKEDIFFVTPDVKRGLGFAGILPGYHIICSDFEPVIPILRRQNARVFCLEEEDLDVGQIRNSGKILENPLVLDYIKKHSNGIPKIMYFKPSAKLDSLIINYKFTPIGNNSALNEFYEDKVNFCKFGYENFADYMIPAEVGHLGELNYPELARKFALPLVVQFGHGWAGKNTFFIQEDEEFRSLKEKFFYTQVKVSKFINGFTVLNNCCIYQDKILVSPPAVQIDGIAELGGKQGVTCGRQWPVKFIDESQIAEIKTISQKIGRMIGKSGFKGFFGIDFLVKQNSGKVFLSEINARMTASSAFFTLLEIGIGNIPLLAYHLADFLGKELLLNKESGNIVGSQLIFRKPIDHSTFNDKLFGVFKIENNKLIFIGENYYPDKLSGDEYIFMARKVNNENTDNEFARIETECEVLEKPGKFNKVFAEIIKSG